jgi:hypothetical protein
MGRPLLQRLLVLRSLAMVLATAFLLSASSARAAIVPACENHQLTRMPVEWLVAFEVASNAAGAGATADTCTPGGEREPRAGDADEISDSRVAAMCDGRGASVVAPPLVRPVADARIDAAYGCSLDFTSSMSGAAAPDDAPLFAPAFALAQPATLDGELLIMPRWSELGPPYPAARGAASAGIRRGIDHPPR